MICRPPGDRDQFVRLEQLHGDRLLQQHMFPGPQAIARDRKVRVLRRGADIDRADVCIAHDILVVERCACRIGEGLDLGQAVRADLADMELPAQRRARQRFGADAAAPAGADHCGFGSVHWVLLSIWTAGGTPAVPGS